MSRNLLKKALESLDRGRRVAMATVFEARGSVPGKPGAKMLVFEDGSQWGTVGGAGLEEKVKASCREALRTGKGGLSHYDLLVYREGGLDSLCGGSVEVGIEVLLPRPHLLICGGGHVGREVARVAVQMDYDYSVLDDRPEYASAERFPEARHRFVASPSEFFARQELSPFSHMLILGYSHHVDTDLLHDAVRTFPGWIGVIASRTKKKLMFQKLKAKGITDEQLARVECPVGLSIGAETPAEIAVAIVGRIIQHLRERRPTPVEANQT